jgi:hypothetical protein
MSIDCRADFQTLAPGDVRSYNALMIDFTSPMILKDRQSFRVWLARGIAVAADALQIGLAGLTIWGGISPVDDGLDIVVAIILTALLGWHIAFVPSFIVKVIPFADLAPTWTIAVLLATRGANGPQGKGPPEMLDGTLVDEPR